MQSSVLLEEGLAVTFVDSSTVCCHLLGLVGRNSPLIMKGCIMGDFGHLHTLGSCFSQHVIQIVPCEVSDLISVHP